MQAKLLDGRDFASQVRKEVKADVDAWLSLGHRNPYLAVVLVGDDPASASYVRGKTKACREVAIDSDTITFPPDIPESDLLNKIHALNSDNSVDGILVQLPLPAHIDEDLVISSIDPRKDVDGFHPENVGRAVLGQPAFIPATPAGIIEMLQRADINVSGSHAVIIGRSNIVGKPLANILLQRSLSATVTVCHSRTVDLPSHSRQADILIAAIGRAGFVTADMVKPGAVVIDVGINRVEDNSRKRGYRLTGDVAFDEVSEVASAITPVPGGVGPMTIAMLLKNTLAAAKALSQTT